MPHSTLDKVLADAQALSPEEQRRLRAKLDECLTPRPICRTEAAFEQQLLAQGILSAVPPPITLHYRGGPRSAAHTAPGAQHTVVGDDSGGPPVVAVYFLDSSALVKRYAQETGSAWIALLTDP